MRALLLALLVAMPWPVAAQVHDTGRSGPSEVLIRAMRDEMKRTMAELRMEGLAKPYFVSQTAEERRFLRLEGSFGALKNPSESHTRRIRVDVRVGQRTFDNFHYVGQPRDLQPVTGSLPIEDDYDAIRFQIWSLTDGAYKRAVEVLSQKKAYKDARNIQDATADLSRDPVHKSETTVDGGPFDRPLWEDRVRRLSAVFREYPAIQVSEVRLTWQAEHRYFVDSEGRSFVRPDHLFEIRFYARSQAEDGMLQSDTRRVLVPSLGDLPSFEALTAQAASLAQDLTELAAASGARTYLGPVLLEGQAAGEFFNQLLATGVSNPRFPWVEQGWAEKYFKPGSLTSRLGLRVITPTFSVVDDPSLKSAEGRKLIGHYDVDDEGIPARRVQLVKRGILLDVLMSRAPWRDRQVSNGHGRGDFADPITPRIGNLVLTPSETVPAETLKQLLRDEARAFGLDHGLLVRRIAEETSRDESNLLARPVLVYRVDVGTGEEELLRDAQFNAVTMRALRDIIAASDRPHVYNLKKAGPGRYVRGTVPASIVHPSVLLAEMELKHTDSKPDKPPYLKHPHFAASAE